MIEKNIHLPKNTVVAGEHTIEQARAYRAKEHDERKPLRRLRMQRLEKFEQAFAHRLFRMVGTDSHIVDIPCGNGRFFEIFSRAKKLTMVDYSANMLKVCEERFGNPKNVRLIQADISSIPLSDNSADLCFCMRLFHRMKSNQVKLGALKELVRISRKYVAISFYNKNCLRFYWRKILGKKIRGNYFTFEHIAGLAKQIGLDLVDRFPKLNLTEQQCLVIFKKG